jgi:hypothetical protein
VRLTRTTSGGRACPYSVRRNDVPTHTLIHTLPLPRVLIAEDLGNPFVTPEKIAQRLSAAAGGVIDETEDSEGSMSNAMRNQSHKQQFGKRARSPSPIPRSRRLSKYVSPGGSISAPSSPTMGMPGQPTARPGSPMPAVRDINPKHPASVANLVRSSFRGDAQFLLSHTRLSAFCCRRPRCRLLR